ncbi:DUF6597 domain-containing transcriptional factor [Actinoallomurus acanthiterrae]
METAPRARTTSYAEWAPPAEFAADVRCVWWSSFGGTAPILPDGHLDLVVGNGRVRVAGPDTAAAANDSPEGLVVHGIRFRTGRARRILGVPGGRAARSPCRSRRPVGRGRATNLRVADRRPGTAARPGQGSVDSDGAGPGPADRRCRATPDRGPAARRGSAR